MYNPGANSQRRELPSNVISQKPSVSNNKVLRVLTSLLIFAPIRSYILDFFKFKVFLSKKNFLKWFNSLVVYKIQYKQVKTLLKDEKTGNLIFYSYWAEAPIFTTQILDKYFKILRMHRVDVYISENNGYLPIRQEIYNKSNLLIPISEDIMNLLQEDYKIRPEKISLSRLGVDNKLPFKNNSRENQSIRLVTCSRVEKVKRLDLLLNCLKNYNGKHIIEWHHFGDGILLEDLKIKAININPLVRVVFHGWTSQEKLFSFYKDKHVDWFVNVSSSEGIPVSIMEAMSFGIPVIATDVGGSREIVNDTNGFLIEKEFSSSQLLKYITDIEYSSIEAKRINAYKTWKTFYNSNKNYEALVKLIESRSSNFK